MRTTALFAGFLLAAACSPQDVTGDGGTDAGIGLDAGTDVGVDAGVDAGNPNGCPSYDGGESWCTAKVAHCNRCPDNALKCEKDMLVYCELLGSSYSTEVRAIHAQCTDAMLCTHGPQVYSTCVKSALDAMALNTARSALASAWCAKCDASNPQCASTFFHRDSVDRGAFLSDYKDAVINDVKLHCVDAITNPSTQCGLFIPCGFSWLPEDPPFPDLCKADGGH